MAMLFAFEFWPRSYLIWWEQAVLEISNSMLLQTRLVLQYL
jgi:hypothetical protein